MNVRIKKLLVMMFIPLLCVCPTAILCDGENHKKTVSGNFRTSSKPGIGTVIDLLRAIEKKFLHGIESYGQFTKELLTTISENGAKNADRLSEQVQTAYLNVENLRAGQQTNTKVVIALLEGLIEISDQISSNVVSYGTSLGENIDLILSTVAQNDGGMAAQLNGMADNVSVTSRTLSEVRLALLDMKSQLHNLTQNNGLFDVQTSALEDYMGQQTESLQSTLNDIALSMANYSAQINNDLKLFERVLEVIVNDIARTEANFCSRLDALDNSCNSISLQLGIISSQIDSLSSIVQDGFDTSD